MADSHWRRGFRLLARFGLSFDLHIYPWQLEEAAFLADEFQDTPIALNHAGLPIARDEAGIQEWRRGLRMIARCHNVLVKISGLTMFDKYWTAESLRPCIQETIDIFGPDRCMFGSNFPVDGLYSRYHSLVSAYREAITVYSLSEQRLMLHDNAVKFYRLN